VIDVVVPAFCESSRGEIISKGECTKSSSGGFDRDNQRALRE
jgi:hypothetical protein